MDEAIKLYEFDYHKPELEDAVIHYGIKGMHWGVRKDGMPQGYQGSGRGRKKKTTSSKVRSVKKRQIGKNKSPQGQRDVRKVTREDLEEVSRNREKYSTNEINDILNRMNTEQRLDDMLNKQSQQSQSRVKQILKSPEFKRAATVTLIALPLVIYGLRSLNYKMNAHPKEGPLNDMLEPTFIMTDIPRPQKPKIDVAVRALANLLLDIKVPKI